MARPFDDAMCPLDRPSVPAEPACCETDKRRASAQTCADGTGGAAGVDQPQHKRACMPPPPRPVVPRAAVVAVESSRHPGLTPAVVSAAPPFAAGGVRAGGVRFQIMQVTPLPAGQLVSIRRNAKVATRAAATCVNPKAHVLVFGRMEDGTSVHVQLMIPVGFFVRVPDNWDQRQASAIALAMGAESGVLLRRVNLVGFTPHRPETIDCSTPQAVSYVRVAFAQSSDAERAFFSIRTPTGVRKGDWYWLHTLKRAGIDPRSLKTMAPHYLSAHDLSDVVADFFDSVNVHLGLRKPNLATYETWITVRSTVSWLPAERYFANSDRNAVIGLTDIVGAENTLVSAPMFVTAYDIEQFSHIDVHTGLRGFPQYGHKDDRVEQISVCHSRGRDAPKTRVFVRKDAVFREPRDDVSKGMDIVVCTSEANLLLQWALEISRAQSDMLTGYNIACYDNRVVFARAYLFWLCQTMPFAAVREAWACARENVPKFEALKKRVPNFGADQKQQMQAWFNIPGGDHKALRAPPVQYTILSEVPVMDEPTYAYFSSDVPIEGFFFMGKVPTWRIGYTSTLYQTSASGELPMQFFTQTGYAQLCCWYMLKKSQYRLEKYDLKHAMQRFCPSVPKVSDMSISAMMTIFEKGTALDLGDVARHARMLCTAERLRTALVMLHAFFLCVFFYFLIHQRRPAPCALLFADCQVLRTRCRGAALLAGCLAKGRRAAADGLPCSSERERPVSVWTAAYGHEQNPRVHASTRICQQRVPQLVARVRWRNRSAAEGGLLLRAGGNARFRLAVPQYHHRKESVSVNLCPARRGPRTRHPVHARRGGTAC